MRVAEACDNGRSVLFSPTGLYIAPAALSLPASLTRLWCGRTTCSGREGASREAPRRRPRRCG
eukprot:7006141-Pyramimonas_sp.AAC.1